MICVMSNLQCLSNKRLLYTLLAAGLLLLTVFLVPPPFAQSEPLPQATSTGILAEAFIEANVRSGPGIEYEQLGTIYAGTRYEVYGKHEFFPWILLQFPASPSGRAWVYADLVGLNISLQQVPLVTSSALLHDSPTASPLPAVTSTQPPADEPVVSSGLASTPSAADIPSVYLESRDEINVRFGPGIDYPRIGQIAPGTNYPIMSRHALYPWYLIQYPAAPDGVGWVYADVVDVTGNIYELPVITVQEVGWPTLTPTPPFVITSMPPWTVESTQTHGTASIDVQRLGEEVLEYLLNLGFAPEEERFGSVFMVDLASGENFALGDGIAYSGMSLIKIPILVEFYRQVDRPADSHQAELIVNTMICSGNHTANELLRITGGGDEFEGARQVTRTMQALGLQDTFVVAPFKLSENTPPVDYPVSSLTTSADQSKAVPDPFNQTTPADLGWLLNAVYQCAANENGPLMEVFPGQFTPTECRQMISTMSSNQINVLTEAGVPIGTRVAHKHGWIDDTHGDAAIVYTPGGNFVLTMAFHQPDWLPYDLSWPTMAEVARQIYNTYNPDSPLDAIHPATVDESCNLAGNPILSELTASVVPPIE